MKSGYKIYWTAHALSELENTLNYLKENWTERELKKFSRELDHSIELLSRNPRIFPLSSQKNNIRRVVILKFNTLYYRIKNDSVEILSFFSNRQDPGKLKT
ncbi:type II toxin-antitoxin system RelE/ParE family toxin [Gramella sp. GC03-9]|uniref:Type II toxin-antitoxin system RelE/ParE family toxin n=1 Tax=Christiangramia oceanisediminis TaxID=2920386 RepID=A0A9X2KWB5_9FLAO|nr:type II toxin-antitoxin system RelE/ParE family toxin [Gramella oceanisediminis]MCP9199680.1 type II toxin-antitoxin system RelE/ParE family toxin [Gramella oceanisediminis]